VQKELEDSYTELVKNTDAQALELLKSDPAKASAYLTGVCSKVANETTARWKKLGEYLLVKYMDGNVKKEKDGKFEENGYGQIVMANYPGDRQEDYDQVAKSGEAKHLEVPQSGK